MMKSLDLTETRVSGRSVYDGVLLNIFRDVVTLPDGHEEVREVIRHPGAALIIPALGEDRYVMVRQYRYALQAETLEFPAGRLDPGEDPQQCARRELAEETGYRAGAISDLFKIHPAPGYSDELIYVFRVDNLLPGESDPDPDEILLTVEITLDELLERFKNGQITDSKTVVGLLYLSLFRGGKW